RPGVLHWRRSTFRAAQPMKHPAFPRSLFVLTVALATLTGLPAPAAAPPPHLTTRQRQLVEANRLLGQARALARQGRLGEASRTGQQAIALAGKAVGERSPTLLDPLELLADWCLRNEDWPGASAAQLRRLAILKGMKGYFG